MMGTGRARRGLGFAAEDRRIRARAATGAETMRGNKPPSSAAGAAVVRDRRVMARAMGTLFLAGATIGLASILLPHPRATNVGALEVNIGIAYAGGFAGLLFFDRLPRWVFHVALILGALLITRAIYYSGEGGRSFYGVWYLWVALFAFSFFGRVAALAHAAFVAVAYAVVQQLTHESMPVARWLTTVGTLLIAGAFLDSLVRRVRRQVDAAADDAKSMTAVVNAMRSVFGHSGPEATRAELCKTALEVARSDFAVLWEPAPDGTGLTATACEGAAEVGEQLPFQGSHSGALRAFVGGKVLFAADVAAEEGRIEDELGEGSEVVSALWQPVLRDDMTVAVLSVYWRSAVAELAGNIGTVLSLLAAQVPIAVERADLLTRLERVARTDDLTGLPNRRAWEEELPREMKRAVREDRPLCVAMIDLDGFKELNDSLGHQAGDQLLKQVASAWGSALRLTDVLVRYGGDEFAAVLPHCTIEQARQLVGRLLTSTPANQSCSVGLVQWDGRTNADGLLGEADSALYEAKRAGGNRIFVGGNS